MPDATQLGKDYNFYMGLIKQRLVQSEKILAKKEISILETETIALQIRKICEALAYACLLALNFKENGVVKKYLKEYSADKIINYVVRIDRNCFPTPIHIEINPETRFHQSRPVEGRIPTPAEIFEAYRSCHPLLHEFKHNNNVTAENNPKETLSNAVTMLKALTKVHQVKIGDTFVVVIMGDSESEPPLCFTAG